MKHLNKLVFIPILGLIIFIVYYIVYCIDLYRVKKALAKNIKERG